MSVWAHLNGIINVDAIGRTQEEATYILQTVLKHLPRVDSNMEVHLIQQTGYNRCCGADEFGQTTNLLKDGWQYIQSNYIIVVHCDACNCTQASLVKTFSKWMNRLAKRTHVLDVMAKVTDDVVEKPYVFENTHNAYTALFEYPSWTSDGEPAWYEYLMWLPAKNDMLPRQLVYKYYDGVEDAKLVETWLRKGGL